MMAIRVRRALRLYRRAYDPRVAVRRRRHYHTLLVQLLTGLGPRAGARYYQGVQRARRAEEVASA